MMVTARHDVACPTTTLSQFSGALSECHCQPLEGLTKCLQTGESWGIKCCRPEDRFLNDLPDSDCQEPAPLPDAIGEFTAEVSQPKLIGSVDAGCGSELQEQSSVTGRVFTLSGGTAIHESKTQTITASSSTEAEFIAASTAAKLLGILDSSSASLDFHKKSQQRSTLAVRRATGNQ